MSEAIDAKIARQQEAWRHFNALRDEWGGKENAREYFESIEREGRRLRRENAALRAELERVRGERDGGLSFDTLRAANMARLPLFKNRRGEPAHSEPDGSDWALSAWCNAVTGELGEAANLIKKIERGDFTLDEARGDLAKELADVATYLDILAFRAGVDLGRATVAKWNEVSERVGCGLRIDSAAALFITQTPTEEGGEDE